MEELTGKFYDLATKQEIPKEKLEPYKMYMYIEDDYCGSARMLAFDKEGTIIDSTYMNYKEKLIMLTEIIRLKYMNLGNTDVHVKFQDTISIDKLQIRMPHILVTYINANGEVVEEMLNENTMENMMDIDEQGNITIDANNSYIGNDDYINKSGIRNDLNRRMNGEEIEDEHISLNLNLDSHSKFEINFKDNEFENIDISGLENASEIPNWKVSIDQFGFKGNYDLSDPKDMERFKTDIKAMPKNAREAQERGKKSSQRESAEIREQ